jgi:predicted transcriptional regulator YheO
MMVSGKSTSKKLIQQIREGILNGKSKYHIAKEMKLSPETVYRYTKDNRILVVNHLNF